MMRPPSTLCYGGLLAALILTLAHPAALAQAGEGTPTAIGVGETLSGVVLSARRLSAEELRQTHPALAAALAPDERLERVTVRITRGALAGDTVQSERLSAASDPPMARGARVTLDLELTPNTPARLILSDYERAPAWLLLLGLCFTALLLLGGSGALWLLAGGSALMLTAYHLLLPAAATSGVQALLLGLLVLMALMAGLARLSGITGRHRLALLVSALLTLGWGLAILALAMALTPLSGTLHEAMIPWPPALRQTHYSLAGLFWVGAVALPVVWGHHQRLAAHTMPRGFAGMLAQGRAALWPSVATLGLMALALAVPFVPLWQEIPPSALMNREDSVSWLIWLLGALLAATVSLPITAGVWRVLITRRSGPDPVPDAQT